MVSLCMICDGGRTMEELKQRILAESTVLSSDVIKLDALLNQQVDPQLMVKMGKAFAELYRDEQITRVVTVESSGIPVAFATALELGVPLVFARRKKTLLADADALVERVPSFTKGIVTDIMLSRQFVTENDRILFIDDIIANGDAARGLVKIIQRSGATLVGVGIVIEKSFQNGANMIREQGIRLDSLVQITSLADGKITFG